MKLIVSAPATSANLGPGFDCLGLALDVWARVEIEVARDGQRPAGGVAALVQQGLRSVFEAEGKKAPLVEVRWDAGIPLARGLGGSAALRGAGLLAGNALLEERHDVEELLSLGATLEGHADNMAPALLGGLQVVVRAEGGLMHVGAKVPPALRVVLFVPDFEMPTQESRRRLPAELSREDAVFNASRVGLLLTALANERYDLLEEATRDRIHQPTRRQIFPGMQPIMAAAKDGGAVAAYLSGGGSTIAAFTVESEERVARLMTQAALAHGFSGRSIITRATENGASIVG